MSKPNLFVWGIQYEYTGLGFPNDHAQKVSMDSQVDVQNFELGFTHWKTVIKKPKSKASNKLESKLSKQNQ